MGFALSSLVHSEHKVRRSSRFQLIVTWTWVLLNFESPIRVMAASSIYQIPSVYDRIVPPGPCAACA